MYSTKDNFVRDLRFRLFDHDERVKRCNILRTRLMKKMVAFRNCAPEYETLFDPEIAMLAKEHVGLFEEGVWIDRSGLNLRIQISLITSNAQSKL